MMNRKQVEALLELAEMATPGPWIRSRFGFNILTHDSSLSTCTQRYTGEKRPTEDEMEIMDANAAYIVAACNQVPTLARRLLACMDAVDAARECLPLVRSFLIATDAKDDSEWSQDYLRLEQALATLEKEVADE